MSSPPSKAEVGVLFVHGIGQQKRGETLVDFGEPLHEWVSRWLTFIRDKWLSENVSKQALKEWFDRVHGATTKEKQLRYYEALRPLLDRAQKKAPASPLPLEKIANNVRSNIVGAHVRLRDAALLSLPNELHAPPQATLEVLLLMIDGSVKETKWLLAESWWADAFRPPRFVDLARWGLVILPWTASSHFGARIRRSYKRLTAASGAWLFWHGATLVMRGLEFFLGLVLVLTATELVLLFLLLLTPIRVSFVGRFISAVQRSLADFIGDSYAVVVRPIQAAAIIGQVQRDLEWLSSHCDSAVMVGHSQGGALAHLALRSKVPSNLKTLLTFGSGLRKLEELRLAEASKEIFAGLLSFVGVAAVVAAAILWALQMITWASVAGLSGTIALVAGLALAVKGLGDAEISYWAGLFKQAPIEWEDYYASADPVPNGPLLDDDVDDQNLVTSTQIRNRASPLRDHTTYWKNLDEFVSRVAVAVGRHCPIDLTSRDIDPRNDLTLKGAPARRRWRAEWLRGTRWLIGAFTVAALFVHGPDLVSWGTWLRNTVPPVPGLTAPQWFLDSTKVLDPTGARGYGLLGAALLVTISLSALGIVNLCWHWWNHEEVKMFFSRRLDTVGRRSAPFFLFCTVSGAVTALGTSAVVPRLWDLAESSAPKLVLFIYLAIGLLLSGIVRVVVGRLDAAERARFTEAVARAFAKVPETEPDAADLVSPEVTRQLQNVPDNDATQEQDDTRARRDGTR